MGKFFSRYFIVLGVIFFMLIVAAVYLYIVEPFNFGNGQASGESSDEHPLLSESQENVLKTFGVDVSALPSSVTPEQRACFESKLGKERVAEIKAGDSPTAEDIYRAKGCI